MPFYPRLSDDTLLSLKLILQYVTDPSEPNYLGDKSCPYPPEIKEMFRLVRDAKRCDGTGVGSGGASGV